MPIARNASEEFLDKNVNDAIYRNEQNNDKYTDSDLPDFPLSLDFLPFKGLYFFLIALKKATVSGCS